MQKESLAARRDLILETVSHLLDCQVELWLDEALFRLPGLNQISFIPCKTG